LSIAGDIDPGYAAACVDAMAAGVEMICHGTCISPKGITLTGSLPFERPS